MATYLTKILLIILLPVLLIAEENVLENIYGEMLITYSTIRSYEAMYLQENYWVEMDVDKVSKGKLYYDEENLLMDYSEPDGQKLLINNEELTMYDPVNNQAVITNEFDIELRPAELISQYWDISEKKIIDEYDRTVKIELRIPEAETIVITLTDKLLKKLTLIDPNGNFVIYKFSDIKVNEALPENIFKLILPEDVNLIDTRYK